MRLNVRDLKMVFAVLLVSCFLSCAHTRTESTSPEAIVPEVGPDATITATPVPEDDGESQDRPRITLQWRTESESDNFGFNVYRGESRDGPFKKINKEIIPGAGTSGTPHEYTFTDFDVVRLKVYFYYLESVSFEGVKQKFSPIISQQVPPGKHHD